MQGMNEQVGCVFVCVSVYVIESVYMHGKNVDKETVVSAA